MSASRFTVFYYLLFTIYYLLFTIYYLLFTIYYLLFTIYYLLFTIYYLLFTIYYLLFTIYYLRFRTESDIFLASRAADPEERPEWHPLWKISRNLDFLHRGPPTLNVGQQTYCFLLFTIYYLLFRTESENSLHRGQPTQRNSQNGPLLFTLYYSRPEWPPSIYSVLFPMENLPKARFCASRATNPECRPADLLFFAIYYLLFTIYYLLFTIYYLLFTIYYLLFTIYYLLFTIYYLLFTIYYLLFTIYYLLRRARIPCIAGSRPRGTARMAPFSLLCTIHGLSGPLLFTLYYSLWKISRKRDFLHREPPTLNVGQQTYCFLLFTIYYLLFTIYYLLFTIYYLLFTIYYLLFTIYYLLFRTESENSLHRGQPTQRNSQNGPLLFTLYYSRPEWPPSIYSVLFSMENFAKPGCFASRATNPECRPADLLFFAIYYLLFTI